MKGYIKNPAATTDCIDDEGYFHSGDICVRDDTGNYMIVDRIKELIKYKGFQVCDQGRRVKGYFGFLLTGWYFLFDG